MNKIKISGLLYFLAGAIVLMLVITAEAFYPSGRIALNRRCFNNESDEKNRFK